MRRTLRGIHLSVAAAVMASGHSALASSCVSSPLVDFVDRAQVLILIRGGDRLQNPQESWLVSGAGPTRYEFELIDAFRGQVAFTELHSLDGWAGLDSGDTFLISVSPKGRFNQCDKVDIGPDPDAHPWIRVLRARAKWRIAAITNPWQFIDSGKACYLRHRLDRGDASLAMRYLYSAKFNPETIQGELYEYHRGHEFGRSDLSELPGKLETIVRAHTYEWHSEFEVHVGGDHIPARPAPLAVNTRGMHAELIGEQGTKRLLRALRFGDGSELEVTWKRTDRLLRISPEGDIDYFSGVDSVEAHSVTEKPFFDNALEDFRSCVRNKGK